MRVEASVMINAPQELVWRTLTDLRALVSGRLEHIPLLSHPVPVLAGMPWRETRILFGRPLTSVKWWTTSSSPTSYRTWSEGSGFVYSVTVLLSQSSGSVLVTGEHETIPVSLFAKCRFFPARLFYGKALQLAVMRDLIDLKTLAEQRRAAAGPAADAKE